MLFWSTKFLVIQYNNNRKSKIALNVVKKKVNIKGNSDNYLNKNDKQKNNFLMVLFA